MKGVGDIVAIGSITLLVIAGLLSAVIIAQQKTQISVITQSNVSQMNELNLTGNGTVGNLTILNNLTLTSNPDCNGKLITVNGLVLCGVDQTGGSGGNYNSTNGFTGNVSIGGTYPILATNISGSPNNTITLSFSNTSYANLDARQTADNASIIRTNRNGFIIGGLNVTTFLNATEIWASQFNGSMDCKYITGSPDTDFCTDAGAAGTVTSINTVAGDVILRGTSMINLTGNSTDIVFSFNNLSL